MNTIGGNQVNDSSGSTNWRRPATTPTLVVQDSSPGDNGFIYTGVISDPNAVETYIGVIADRELCAFTESIEHQRLEPKPRMHNKDWIEGHNKQKQCIAAGEVKKLVIGDSIVKHLNSVPVSIKT